MDKRRRKEWPLLVGVFVVAAAIVIIVLINIFNKNIVINPGVLNLDDSLTQAEKDFVTQAFGGKTLKNDVTISAESVTSIKNPITELNTSRILYDTLIPVGNFYNVGKDLTAQEALQLATITEPEIAASDNNFYLISIQTINDTVRAETIDGDYYFDNLLEPAPNEFKGAVFRVFKIDSNESMEAYSILSSAMPGVPTDASVLSINQTGVVALTRRMQNVLNKVGDGSYFAEKIADFLKSTDFTHVSNEVSFADNCTNTVDMAFCADPRMFSVLTDSGVNIVELTGNHNNDWGAAANLDTIKLYHDNNMHTFGGGENAEKAAEPLEIVNKDNDITWIAVNYSTSTKANGQGATEERPGANIYDEATTRAQIEAAKAKGDFVIVDVQYFECWSYPGYGEEIPACDYPISGQEAFFKGLIDMGADMVVGTQAHQPQTFELYNGKPIYYGLGNLFFDQTDWPGTRRSLVLTHYFYKNKLLQTKITPTIYDSNFQTEIMDAASAESFLNRLTASYRQ